MTCFPNRANCPILMCPTEIPEVFDIVLFYYILPYILYYTILYITSFQLHLVALLQLTNFHIDLTIWLYCHRTGGWCFKLELAFVLLDLNSWVIPKHKVALWQFTLNHGSKCSTTEWLLLIFAVHLCILFHLTGLNIHRLEHLVWKELAPRSVGENL